jgi:putative endonuclease
MADEIESKSRFLSLPAGWCCYLLLCSDNSYYCGMTSNLPQRLVHHSSGRGSGYTKGTKPIALVWYEACIDRSSAALRERQLKKWSHRKKLVLTEGALPPAFGARARVSLG